MAYMKCYYYCSPTVPSLEVIYDEEYCHALHIRQFLTYIYRVSCATTHLYNTYLVYRMHNKYIRNIIPIPEIQQFLHDSALLNTVI